MTDVLAQTTAIQRRVADPYHSAWVSANAGTGKTYVLVRRVIRQLLAGAAPQSILCITYTKAAAAEMSHRLLGMLSTWSLMPDDELSQQIEEVTGQQPGKEEQERARRLFALALESPGGLKIQTIHSFCSSILSRFPAEAGLPLGFRPLEDDQAAAMLQQSVARVAETFAADPQLAEHFQRVSARFQGREGNAQRSVLSLEQILYDHASRARGLEHLNTAELVQRLAQAVGANPADDAEAIFAACVQGMNQQFLREFVTVFRTGSDRDKKLAENMQALVREPTIENCLASPPILTGAGTVLKLKSKVRTQIDNFDQRWTAFAEHMMQCRDRWLALEAFDENISLMITSQAVMRSYTATKDREAALDYEDLIRRTLHLLRDVSASWVRFKLDAGIDHILIDEAQDNSGAQWEIFQQLADEIVSMDPELADRPRSIFVVGDPKQSIYAFQGAEARLFQRTRSAYKDQMDTGLADEELFVSFRTAQPILDVVDAVFDRDDFKLITGHFPNHASAHGERPGSVTLWPDFPAAEKIARSAFDQPVDAIPDESVDQRVAEAIARDIRTRLANEERLACKKGKVLQPQDILVLFQRRGARFKAFLRAVADVGVPCEGSDRVGLKDEQAVLDLVSLLRFAANTDDSLSLAELLRSPIFGWSEDNLFDLAAERERAVLWLELKRRAESRDGLSAQCAAVEDVLQSALNAGARHGPYALLTSVLESGGRVTGRQRFARRMGAGYRQAVDAFLDHALSFEERGPRSVQAFLTHAERLSADVKRELTGDKATGVRVMTVHGSKGLEAPVVYLADADYLKGGPHLFRFDPLAKPVDGGLPVLLPSSSKLDGRTVAALRTDEADRRYEEYQRLLYVAMTRAEEHLVVCGGKEEKKADRNWCSLVRRGFGTLEGRSGYTATVGDGETLLRYSSQRPVPVSAEPAASLPRKKEAPAWLVQEPPSEAASPVIYPSLHGDVEPREAASVAPAGDATVDARRRGLLIHKLLERLPLLPPDEWQEEAALIASSARSVLGDDVCEQAVSSAIALMVDARFQQLFGLESRGEVAIQGELDGATVSGEIDRLVVLDDRVIVGEFKTTRWVPESEKGVQSSHREQVTIYRRLVEQVFPNHEVEAWLVYVAAPIAFRVA